MAENGVRRRNGNARRCLFPAGEDRERNLQDLDELVKKEEKASAEAFKKRWNFDIQKETPDPGRYEWEKIQSDQSVPSTSVSHLPSPDPQISPKISCPRKSKPNVEKADADVAKKGIDMGSETFFTPPKPRDFTENIQNLTPEWEDVKIDKPKPPTSELHFEHGQSPKTVNTGKNPSHEMFKGGESNTSLATLSSSSDNSVPSSTSSEEKDFNENVVTVVSKRKTATTLHEEESSSKEAKRARPP